MKQTHFVFYVNVAVKWWPTLNHHEPLCLKFTTEGNSRLLKQFWFSPRYAALLVSDTWQAVKLCYTLNCVFLLSITWGLPLLTLLHISIVILSEFSLQSYRLYLSFLNPGNEIVSEDIQAYPIRSFKFM